MTGDEYWYRWVPDIADDPDFAHVTAAVDSFESMDTEAGRAATAWLKYEALANHPYTVTWLMIQDGLLQGYYALCSAEVLLTRRQRKELEPDEHAHKLHPRQPASLVAWIAKHREATAPGEYILLHAVFTALKVAELQGNVVVAVDPFDQEAADFWQDRYGFRPSQRTDDRKRSNRPTRLWMPLQLRDVTD